MLDGLLKSKFYTKCKNSIKMTKTRLELLKKKKCAVAKYLKEDIAHLLRNKLDHNAYGRAEMLLVEQTAIARYNFIEQFIGCISNNLPLMDKQRECPEECKEAVQSLIYAAARISELRELRDLRDVFAERYRNSLELLINKEFVKTLEPEPATKEMKLLLMQNVAVEFHIEWSCKSKQKLFTPAAAEEEEQQRHEPSSLTDIGAEYRWRRKDKDGDDCSLKSNRSSELSFHSRRSGSNEDDRRYSTDQDSFHGCSSSVGSFSEDDEADNKKPFSYKFVPPPYVRPKSVKEESESKIVHPSKVNGYVKDEGTNGGDLGNEVKPKPKSVRRRPTMKLTQVDDVSSVDSPLKSPQGNTDNADRPLKPLPGREKFVSNGSVRWFGKSNLNPSEVKEEEKAKVNKPSSRFAKAEEIDEDQRDEEEKLLDGLLMHYCKDKARPENVGGTSHRIVKSELPVPRGREEEILTAKKTAARHSRAASMQPEITGHVHPKLPDCDDLAAQISALKRR